MPSHRTYTQTALGRTAAALLLPVIMLALAGSHSARGFYMPTEFDMDMVDGGNGTSVSSASSRFTGTSGAFSDVRNRTKDDGEERAGPSLGARDVWSPRITEPNGTTVWKTGKRMTVRWATSDRPKHVTNYKGKLVLGHYEDGNANNEHLDIEHPLADGFNLTKGHIEVTVPDVPPSNEYIVVLLGDSGNRSPLFTITE